jgi:hypothetical protein
MDAVKEGLESVAAPAPRGAQKIKLRQWPSTRGAQQRRHFRRHCGGRAAVWNARNRLHSSQMLATIHFAGIQ